MKGHYSLSSLFSLLRDPSRIDEALYLLHEDAREPLTAINRAYYKWQYRDIGERIITDEWDTLIILDAARPDYLIDTLEIEGATWQTKYSNASYSYGFMKQEFEDQTLHDTVYVTANPYISRLDNNIFYKVVNLYESAWDSTLQTVPPEAVVNAISQIREEYPAKRYIAHFMQPHFPFLGNEYGDKIDAAISPPGEDGGRHPWRAQMYGRSIDRDVLLAAYQENHEVVAPYARKVAVNEPGTAVITADHANLVGERGRPVPLRYYGHPADFPHPALTEVPWVTVGNSRRETTSDEPINTESPAEEIVIERLEHLGYRRSEI